MPGQSVVFYIAMGHLTYSSFLILQSIAAGYRYGFDVIDATGLPSGTVYPALRRLAGRGYLSSSWEQDDSAREAGRPRRRYYQITATGRDLLAQAAERFRRAQRLLPVQG